MPSWPGPLQLRRAALAVAVLHDVDLDPAPGGVLLRGDRPLKVRWAECRRALAGAEAESDVGRRQLARWLRWRRWLADHPLEVLAELARPYGVAVESEAHPGMDWVRRRVMGDTLEVGLGFVGLDANHPETVHPVSQQVLHAAGIDPSPWWPTALVYLERMGETAAERIARDPTAPLRPMGDCDVVTLLASRILRDALVRPIDGGMRTVAVPMRNRGWLDLNRIDPAFSATAAQITPAEERGFDRPLLVTREEVVLARDEGGAIRAALEDRLRPAVDIRSVLYHSA
ncbi:MAG TPA: hypothetical protein VG650_13970 [Mycobacteriales bacterium]|nr:hypothetical protein [Mycobacteriales bacterium]